MQRTQDFQDLADGLITSTEICDNEIQITLKTVAHFLIRIWGFFLQRYGTYFSDDIFIIKSQNILTRGVKVKGIPIKLKH